MLSFGVRFRFSPARWLLYHRDRVRGLGKWLRPNKVDRLGLQLLRSSLVAAPTIVISRTGRLILRRRWLREGNIFCFILRFRVIVFSFFGKLEECVRAECSTERLRLIYGKCKRDGSPVTEFDWKSNCYPIPPF